jgi:hypothetical protein
MQLMKTFIEKKNADVFLKRQPALFQQTRSLRFMMISADSRSVMANAPGARGPHDQNTYFNYLMRI